MRNLRGVVVVVFSILFAVMSACAPEQASDDNGGQMQGPDQAAKAPTLEPSWVVTGFEQPESARYDAVRDVIYVSNISGQPLEANGAGFISLVSPSGEMLDPKWVEGLNAPKGLGLYGDSLFIADIDRIVEVNVNSGERIADFPVSDAQFLNDIAVADDGTVYVSDMLANRIYALRNGAVSVYLESDELENPNGLYVHGDLLFVGAWGVITDKETFSTETPGRLLVVALGEVPTVTVVGEGPPVGNLDGLEGLDNDGFFATDWVSGIIYYIDPEGIATDLLTTNQGSADIGIIRTSKVLLVPMMMDGELRAFTYSF